MKVSVILVALAAAVVASPVDHEKRIPSYTLPPYPTGYLEKRDIDARAYPTAPPKPTGYYHKREVEEREVDARAYTPTGYYMEKRDAAPAPGPTGYYMEKREAEAEPVAEPVEVEARGYPVPTGYYMDKRNKRAFLPSGYSAPPLPTPTYFPKPKQRVRKA